MSSDTIARICVDEITNIASGIQDRELVQRLLGYAVHIAQIDDQRHPRRQNHQPPTTRQKIDRLLDHLDEKTQDEVYWLINKRLSM